MTQPSGEATEEARRILSQHFVAVRKELEPCLRTIALAIDQAKAEGAKRVVRAVMDADYNVDCENCEAVARELRRSASQALQEVKGERK